MNTTRQAEDVEMMHGEMAVRGWSVTLARSAFEMWSRGYGMDARSSRTEPRSGRDFSCYPSAAVA